MSDWAKKQKARQKQLKRIESSRNSYKWLYLIVLVTGLGLPLVGLGAYFYQGYEPRTELEFSGNTIIVRKGGDFQAALNRAKPGDTISLEAGATFKGKFVLPRKDGNQFITIRSSADSQLPPAEARLEPQKHAPFLPKILTTTSEPAITTQTGANYYRFVGVEISSDSDKYVYNLVLLGDENLESNQQPKYFEFDRVYLHPNPKGKTRRGFGLFSSETTIKNSHISGFAYPEEETQAISSWAGPGPYKIINNYLEAGAENLFFGGDAAKTRGVVPSDIEIRRNYMTKPLEWRGKVGIKCTLELKAARRVYIAENIIENSFDENAIRLTVRGGGGAAPWNTIEDVVMENNIIRNSGGGINILGKDDSGASGTMKRVKIVNNLFLEIDAAKWGGDARFITISDGEDITVANNTVFHSGNIITAHGSPTKRFVFRDNIISHNNYGYAGDNGTGQPVLARYFPDGVFTGNVIVNGKNIEKQYVVVPQRSLFAPNFQNVGFTDAKNSDFRLAPNSPFKGKGANGKDPGIDFNQFEKILANKPM